MVWRKGAAEGNKRIIYEVIGALAVMILLALFVANFFGTMFPPKAVASAKVVCFSVNSVYGDQESGGWVSADQITDDCEKKASSASMTGAVTGAVSGAVTGLASHAQGTAAIRAICEKGKYGAPDGKVGCRVANFELPQTSNTGLTDKYMPGAGDPDYVLYYGEYPKVTADAAWGNWAAFNLATTIVPVGKLAKGGGALIKGVAKVGDNILKVPGVPGRSIRLVTKPFTKAGSKTIEIGKDAAGEVAERVVKLGFRSGEVVHRQVRYWIEWAGELGYHRLNGKTIDDVVLGGKDFRFVTGPVDDLAGKDAGELVQNGADKLLRIEQGVYEFNLKAMIYLIHRNGIRAFDEEMGGAAVRHLGPDDLGKIDAAAQKRALESLESGDYRLIQILVGEREAVEGTDAAAKGIDDLIAGDAIPHVPLSAARKMENEMGLSAGGKALVLTPKFLLIKKGTTTLDNVVGMQDGPGDECVFTLRQKTPLNPAAAAVQKEFEWDEQTFSMSNCKDNPNDMVTSPVNDDTKTGVALHEFSLKSSDLPMTFWTQFLEDTPLGFLDQEIHTATTGFYAASPCLSQGSGENGDERIVVGSSDYFRIYPKTGGLLGTGDTRVHARMPIAAEGKQPNFCYHYPITDIADWPIIDQLTNVFEAGGLSIQEFDLGFAPWPCHGTLVLADAGDEIRGFLKEHNLEDVVPKLMGTCGGG